jgi:DNA-binding MarR family transcriptional regulator
MFILHTLHGVDEDGISLNDLADRIVTDQSSASVVVQRLVEAGLVSRTTRPDDRRHIQLSLTPQGRRIIRNSPPPAQEKMMNAITAMPPAERRKFAKLMEAFVDELGASEKAPMLFEDEK